MKFKIEKYLLKKAEELAFITIKHDGDFQIEGYEIPKSNLDVPIKNEVLVKGIKDNTAQDNLNAMSIADAMIFIIGIDSQFRYNDEYRKFLEAFKNIVKAVYDLALGQWTTTFATYYDYAPTSKFNNNYCLYYSTPITLGIIYNRPRMLTDYRINTVKSKSWREKS